MFALRALSTHTICYIEWELVVELIDFPTTKPDFRIALHKQDDFDQKTSPDVNEKVFLASSLECSLASHNERTCSSLRFLSEKLYWSVARLAHYSSLTTQRVEIFRKFTQPPEKFRWLLMAFAIIAWKIQSISLEKIKWRLPGVGGKSENAHKTDEKKEKLPNSRSRVAAQRALLLYLRQSRMLIS